MQKLIDDIAMVEKRAGISVRDHIGYGNDINAIIEYFKDKSGRDCIGERNSDNNDLHGRGILIYSNGDIIIPYWNNGERAPGSCIAIFGDGEFRVGECYLAEDDWTCFRGTKYNTDGTSEKFDV